MAGSTYSPGWPCAPCRALLKQACPSGARLPRARAHTPEAPPQAIEIVLDLAAAAVLVFVSAAVRGATGFGFALIAAPGLVLFWSLDLATTIVLLLDLGATAVMLRSGALASIRWGDAALLSVSGMVGAAIGVALLSAVPAEPMLTGLNVAILVSALAALLKVEARWLGHPVVGVVAALGTGVMIGAYALGGPLIVAWMIAARRTPAETRALLTVVFGITDLTSLAARLAFGVLPPGAFATALALAPAMVLGILVGTQAFRRLHPETWKRAVALFLLALAIFSLARQLT